LRILPPISLLLRMQRNLLRMQHLVSSAAFLFGVGGFTDTHAVRMTLSVFILPSRERRELTVTVRFWPKMGHVRTLGRSRPKQLRHAMT
jgi:hypothetical protein